MITIFIFYMKEDIDAIIATDLPASEHLIYMLSCILFVSLPLNDYTS